jgi:hypothetical protein
MPFDLYQYPERHLPGKINAYKNYVNNPLGIIQRILNMSISKAVQRGTLVYIYDQDGMAVTSISAAGRCPGDGLKAYTPSSVSVQKGGLLYSYDKGGRQTSIAPLKVAV